MNRHLELSVFAAVSETGSLAAAARTMALSTPTVIRAVASLEQRLNARLLDRSTRGVALTEPGRQFALDCQRILQQLREAEASARGLHVEPRGGLQLSMPLLLGQQIMPPILIDFLAQYPAVQVYARFLDRPPHLHEEGIDVAILAGQLPDSSLFAMPVGQIARIVCASPAYLARAGEPSRPEALSKHQIVHSQADARVPEWRFVEHGNVVAVPIRPRLSVSTNQAAIHAACQNAGLVRCMSYQVHELLAQGRLQRVLQAFEPAPLPVQVVYREGRRAAARVRSFVDFTVSRLRAHPALR